MTSLRRHSPSLPVRVLQTFTGDVHSRHARDAEGGEPRTPHEAEAQLRDPVDTTSSADPLADQRVNELVGG